MYPYIHPSQCLIILTFVSFYSENQNIQIEILYIVLCKKVWYCSYRNISAPPCKSEYINGHYFHVLMKEGSNIFKETLKFKSCVSTCIKRFSEHVQGYEYQNNVFSDVFIIYQAEIAVTLCSDLYVATYGIARRSPQNVNYHVRVI